MNELLPFRHCVTVISEGGETWNHIIVFSRQVVEAEYGPLQDMDEETRNNLASHLTGWGEFHRGVGKAFGAEPSLRIKRNSVEVRQFCGLDI